MNSFNRLVAFYDRNIVKHQGWKPVPGSDIGFLYLVPMVYKGKKVTLDDGCVIMKGDQIFQIHVINTNLANLDTGRENLYTMLKGELIHVGELMQTEEYRDYKALLSVTLLHRLTREVGFTVREIENPLNRKMISLGENILRSALRKGKNVKDGKKRIAKECWISRNQILKLKNLEYSKCCLLCIGGLFLYLLLNQSD